MLPRVNLFIKAFFQRIVNDFRHKELLPLKLLFFVHSSTVFVLYPYLTIHMRELGINVEETAIMSAVTPVVGIIMPPMAGMVADRIGNFRVLMALFSALGGGASLLLLIVPVGRMTVTYPERVAFELGCGDSGGNLGLSLSQEQPCAVLPDLLGPLGKQVETRYEACGFICDADAGLPEDMDSILQAHSYHVHLSGNETNTYTYKLSPEDRRGLSHYRTSIRQVAPGRLFFPTTGLYNLSCGDGGCSLGSSAHSIQQGQSTISSHNKVFRTLLTPQLDGSFIASALSRWTDNRTDNRTDTATLNASCSDEFTQEEEDVLVSVPLSNSTLGPCSPRCLVTAPRKEVCSDMKAEVEFNSRLTFWAYLSIRVLISMIGSTAFAMFEGAVIAILREHKADYGLQRIYATIGGMISSPLSGVLIDYASRGKTATDFRPAFYLYAALKIASGVLMLTFDLEFKTPAKNVVSDVLKVIKNVELVALLFVIFILGSAWGYIESFLFWLLQDLGGSRSLMGVTITVGGIAGIPLLVLSGPIIDRIGHANVLFIGFVFYAIRLLGYSLIYNPWLCLVFEAMESVTSSLSFTAAVTYAAKLSTATTDTSIQGLLGGLYFGVGKGAGSLLGGYLMKWIGTRPTYQVFSGICALVGGAYFIFNKFYLRKRPQVEGNDIVKIKSKFLDAGDMVEVDLTSGNKDKKNKKKKKKNETLPINSVTSKNYASDKDTTNETVAKMNSKNLEVSKPVETCNINLAYDECDDDCDTDATPKSNQGEKTAYDNPTLDTGEENSANVKDNQQESALGYTNETKDCEAKNTKDDKNQKNLEKTGSA